MNKMDDKKFINIVKEKCLDAVANKYLTYIGDLELIQVWFCKIVQNYKGLFIVKNTRDGYIYPYFIEATCNGDKNEVYLDYYIKEYKETVHY